MDRKKLREYIALIAWWAILFLFWIGLTDSLQIPELLAGMLGALLGTWLIKPKSAINFFRFILKRPQLHLLSQIPKELVSDCWRLAVLVLNSIRRRPLSKGEFRTVPIPNGTGDPYAAIRRAFVTAVISFSPNSYVIGVDEEEDFLLLHEMVTSNGEKEQPL